MQQLKDVDDGDLVARCLAGDKAAWEVLVRRYQRLLYAIVRRIGLDDHGAADVFQTVFSRLLQHLPGLREPDRLKAWIVTTGKREALRLRERGQRTVSMTSNTADGEENSTWDLPDTTPLPDEVIEELERQQSVRRGMERLDERCRALLTMLFHDDDEKVAYEVVAERLDMPVGSIGPTRSRCLGKLRKLLD